MKKAIDGVGRGVRLLGYTAISALVLVFLVYPAVTGGAALTVLSGSMSPTYPVGSVVFVVPTDPLTIQPGEVITYQAAPDVAEFVTHRVVRVQPDTTPYSFITQGDANPIEDADPVPIGAVRGTVRFHVPFVGRVLLLLRTPLGLALMLVSIPLVWIAIRQARAIRVELAGASQVVDPDTNSAAPAWSIRHDDPPVSAARPTPAAPWRHHPPTSWTTSLQTTRWSTPCSSAPVAEQSDPTLSGDDDLMVENAVDVENAVPA